MDDSYWNRARTRRFDRRRLLGSAALLTAGAAALAACGKSKSGGGSARQADGSATAAAQPQRGGRFGTHMLSTTNFNIVANWAEGVYTSGANVYDRLISSRTDKRRYVLEAAASVEQPDPLTVTFKLKPNLVYQNLPPVNGRAVSPDDIIATQNYGRSASNAYDNAFQKDFLDQVQAPDDQTVIYKLKSPNGYLFSDTQLGNPTAQAIIPKELLDNLDTNKPVGSGPYYLADYQMNNRYLYKRFDQFRDAGKGLPYVDERLFIVQTDQVALETAFRSEQITIWNANPSSIDRVRNELGSKVAVERAPGIGVFAWHLNMERNLPWQKDPRVREAFYRATNPQMFIQPVFAGYAVVPPGPIPAGLKDYQLDPKETAPYLKTDIAEAKKLLSAAGWDPSREYESISNQGGLSATAAQVWQQQLAQAGIKIRVSELPFAEWLPKRIAHGDYEIIVNTSPGDDTPARSMRLHHSDQKNQYSHFGLHDPEIDAMIEKAERTVDYNENVKLVKQIQMLLLQKHTSVYLFATQDFTRLRNTKLHDWELNPGDPQSVMYQTQMWLSA